MSTLNDKKEYTSKLKKSLSKFLEAIEPNEDITKIREVLIKLEDRNGKKSIVSNV